MEGGLALMWFRMLFWVCSLALVFSRDNTGPRVTLMVLHINTSAPCEGKSVTLRCELSSIQQTDNVRWSRRSFYNEHKTNLADENGLTKHTDSRFSVSPLLVYNSRAGLYSQTLTIDPVQLSDTGLYQCAVKRNTSVIARSTERYCIVHPPDVFPVCFPFGRATVTIGSSLSCKTSSDTRQPIVSDITMSARIVDGWVTSPTNGGSSPGQQMVKTVTNSEHGKTYTCLATNYSATRRPEICRIGPLIVACGSTKVPSTHKPTNELTMTDTSPTTVQTSNSNCQNCNVQAYIAVLIISIVIHLITVILL